MQSTSSTEPQGLPAELGSFFARVGKRIDIFWQRVTEGLEIQVLWSQFREEARSSYSLYTREVDWDALQQETRLKRFLKIARELFWAMLMKLSPARRVFLLLALAIGFLALARGHTTRSDGGTVWSFPDNSGLILLSLGGLVFLLALELADRVTMKRDLEIAREIQRWLVPDVPPQFPGVDIAFASRPANTVGGDYYDAFPVARNGATGSDRLLLVIADVAGKSVPAALLMATFQASLRSLAATPASLPDLVTRINRYACAHSLGGRRFTTAFFAELDPATHAVSYIGAGHDAPVLRRASGHLDRLDAGNLPLGIDPGARYEEATVTLAPGDLLVIFTDGLIEAVNERDEEYGEARLLAAVGTLPVQNAATTLQGLMAAVDAFAGSARQHDDITCLVLRTN